jgi:hypothetical protein
MTEKRPTRYSDYDAVICMGCKTIHIFDDFDMQVKGPVLFPNGDFSVYRVICPKDDQYYEYKEKDILRHKPDSDSSGQVSLLENQIKALESRLERLEGGKWMEARMKELEDFARHFLSEQVNQLKQTPQEVKKATTVPYT